MTNSAASPESILTDQEGTAPNRAARPGTVYSRLRAGARPRNDGWNVQIHFFHLNQASGTSAVTIAKATAKG